jgi:hypothetical protein
LEEQFFATSLIRGQPQFINTNGRSSIDNLIHAMGALNLFASNTMGAMDDTTQRRAKRTGHAPTIEPKDALNGPFTRQPSKQFITCFIFNISIIWDP